MKLFYNTKSENFPNDNNVINNNVINNNIINNVAINNHSPQNHIININVILSIILSIIFIFGIAGCSLPSLDSHDVNNNSYNLQASSDNSLLMIILIVTRIMKPLHNLHMNFFVNP